MIPLLARDLEAALAHAGAKGLAPREVVAAARKSGGTEQSLKAVLGEWQQAGITRVHYGRLVLVDTSKLIRYVEPPPANTKHCKKCDRHLPRTRKHFWADKDQRDGFFRYCKQCVAGFPSMLKRLDRPARPVKEQRCHDFSAAAARREVICKYLEGRPAGACAREIVAFVRQARPGDRGGSAQPIYNALARLVKNNVVTHAGSRGRPGRYWLVPPVVTDK